MCLGIACRLAAGEEALHRSASAKEAEAAPDLAQDMLQTLLDNLNIAGADAAEGRARKILLGLGFTSKQMESPVSKLSGQIITPKDSCQPAVSAAILWKLMLYSLCESRACSYWI